jgi:hypothetical protein
VIGCEEHRCKLSISAIVRIIVFSDDSRKPKHNNCQFLFLRLILSIDFSENFFISLYNILARNPYDFDQP